MHVGMVGPPGDRQTDVETRVVSQLQYIIEYFADSKITNYYPFVSDPSSTVFQPFPHRCEHYDILVQFCQEAVSAWPLFTPSSTFSKSMISS